MDTILSVKSLNKSYGDSRILRDISFEVDSGEFVAIMGQSGSGKSTLLYNISGMDRPSSGQVLLKGLDLSELEEEAASQVRLLQIGFVFQEAHLLNKLSIQDNIILPAVKAKRLPVEEIYQEADRLMDLTSIRHVADHDIKQVSGGQLQRAAICRALINRPQLLIADEPTGALNSQATQEILDILNQINLGGTTIITVTHDANVALRASRIIYLRDGHIHAQLELGPYGSDPSPLKDRQRQLEDWLSGQGF